MSLLLFLLMTVDLASLKDLAQVDLGFKLAIIQSLCRSILLTVLSIRFQSLYLPSSPIHKWITRSKETPRSTAAVYLIKKKLHPSVQQLGTQTKKIHVKAEWKCDLS